jgi:hypothetical protein
VRYVFDDDWSVDTSDGRGRKRNTFVGVRAIVPELGVISVCQEELLDLQGEPEVGTAAASQDLNAIHETMSAASRGARALARSVRQPTRVQSRRYASHGDGHGHGGSSGSAYDAPSGATGSESFGVRALTSYRCAGS